MSSFPHNVNANTYDCVSSAEYKITFKLVSSNIQYAVNHSSSQMAHFNPKWHSYSFGDLQWLLAMQVKNCLGF